MIIDIIGWVAFIALAPSSLFQISKNFRRKSAEGVSFFMSAAIFTGLSLFLIVSLAEPTPLPTIVQFAVGSAGWGIVLLQMAMYRKNKGGLSSGQSKRS